MNEAVRRRFRVEGIVQGVGFRPFTHALARRLGLAGFVRNDAAGARIEVEGAPDAVERFEKLLERDAPPLAWIEAVRAETLPARGERGFSIQPSRGAGPRRVRVSPDIATCEDCLAELRDPADRRYRYPFINCTNCGPRFTIVRDAPYDRPATTMAGFALCAACADEYRDPADRRFHAQPMACPACGPTLALRHRDGKPEAGDPIARTAELLRAGFVVAIKGLGGYHLAVSCRLEEAVATLRARKRREERPLAVMAPDLAWAQRLVELDDAERRALCGPRRPIVVARRLPDAPVAASVAPGNRRLGVMLPYTPLHHLLCAELGEPFVLTSGNLSDEPIAYRDDEATARLPAVADFLLTHDRGIHTRCDDSVLRVHRGRELLLRRSRGYAPQGLPLPLRLARPVLGCGAELKNTFCLGVEDRAFVSHHIGDLESYDSFLAYREGIEHFQRLFDAEPLRVAHDLHPEYLSTKFALELEGVELEGVQHHHAHAAACLAEHGVVEPAIAVCFDGLGYGTDGSLWGGEFLVATLADFERVGHFEPLPMPGGSAAIREPWRMAAVYLEAALGAERAASSALARRHAGEWRAVLSLARSGTHAPPSSSVGRLLDALAALLGVRERVSYEGQAAIELEQLADPTETGSYRIGVTRRAGWQLRGADLVALAWEDLSRGVEACRIAARIHNGLCAAVVEVCGAIREERELECVALGGGVFQNEILLERCARGLETQGFRVLVPTLLPPNDGCISYGQVAVTAARDALAAR